MSNLKLNDRLLLVTCLLSGLVALGFEMVWTRLLTLVLGGELLGVLGVLAGFFLGMVIGAYVLSRHAYRTRNPIRMFVVLELLVAVYGFVSPILIYSMSDWVPQWLGMVAGDNDSLVALSISLLFSSLILLPATFCMGGNFAYLVEAHRRAEQERTRDQGMSRIYAANTAGATIGTFGAAYLVVPILGFQYSCLLFSSASLVAILCAWIWGSRNIQRLCQANGIKDNSGLQIDSDQKKYVVLLFATGLGSVGLEIVVIHLLKQILENTVFTFANILGVYLVGTAIGAWCYQYFAGAQNQVERVQRIPNWLMLGQLLAIATSFFVLTFSHELMEWWTESQHGYVSNLVAELWLSVLVFLPPTLFMGAIFSFLISRISADRIGQAYAANTLGAALAPFVFGLLMVPLLAPFQLLFVVMVFYWFLFAYGVFVLGWSRGVVGFGSLPVMFVAVVLLSSPDLIQLPRGATELQRVEGLMGTVVVSEQKQLPPGPLGLPNRILQVNNQFRMGGGAGFLERRMGNLPLLLAPKTDSVLFLGIGSGTTVGACQNFPTKRITAVEIVPEIRDVLHWFDKHSCKIFDHPNLTYHSADARRFASAARGKYDVIVADLYHPARDGAGLLYTQEHFRKLKSLLSDDGLFCQWIPAHQFDQASFKTVLHSFVSVFDDSSLFLAGFNTKTVAVALIGSCREMRVDRERIAQQIRRQPGIQSVFENSDDVLSTYVIHG
ncbi:MAG: hypothetical protein AAGA30_06895, partial [Planctomycetota bacterium]